MTVNFEKYHDNLLFVPLGGSNEIGMNLNLYAIHGKWLVIDCGIGFADAHFPGVDIMVPDIDFLIQQKENIVGMVLTHAHEDHIGGVPYLWRELECPVYATPFTTALLRNKFAEMGPGPKPNMIGVMPGSSIDLDPFQLDLIGVTHSIPEMQAIAIHTSVGTVMHTGDWKFDENPLVGPVSNYEKLKAHGDKDVMAIVCDSTNVFVEGESGSEAPVREHLAQLIKSCKKRVVVTTFASNVARLESILMAAHDAGRVVALAGRSIKRMVNSAHEAGYLKHDHEFVSEREIMHVPREDLLIISTGCQGESRAALTRMARGDHPHVQLQAGDTVIYSSRKIPGNETSINWTVNQLVRKKIEVVTDRYHNIHVSGHPARDELKRMYELVRPSVAVPTHGEAQHLHEHARLAESLGVPCTVEAFNGAVILLDKDDAEVVGKVKAGYIAIDGSSLIPLDSTIIRQRRMLRDDGALFVSIGITEDGALKSAQLATPGILQDKEDEELIKEILTELMEALEGVKRKTSDAAFIEATRQALRRITKRELDKKPFIEVHIMRG